MHRGRGSCRHSHSPSGGRKKWLPVSKKKRYIDEKADPGEKAQLSFDFRGDNARSRGHSVPGKERKGTGISLSPTRVANLSGGKKEVSGAMGEGGKQGG